MKNFTEACTIYRLLREKGYPEKATLKLVGDRHRLSRVQRNCLFRGVIPDETASRRSRKVLPASSAAGQPLAIDWYNVLITVESYLRGQILFLADDGVVRDASAAHGSFRPGALTARAIEEIVAFVAAADPARVDAYLDAPLSFSGQMAEELRVRLDRLACPSSVDLAPSADYPLKSYHGFVASSDSIVLDSATHVMDLARGVLETRFGFIPLSVQDLFPASLEEPRQ